MIIRIKAWLCALWLTLKGSRPESGPATERNNLDTGGFSTIEEPVAKAKAENDLSYDILQGNFSKCSSDSREVAPELDSNVLDSQSSVLQYEPFEQHLGNEESLKSDEPQEENTEDQGINVSGYPAPPHIGTKEILSDSQKDEFWVFRSPLETSIEAGLLDADNSQIEKETAGSSDADGSAHWWESSVYSSDLREIAPDPSSEKLDSVLQEEPVERSLGSRKTFKSGEVAEENTEDPSIEASGFSAPPHIGTKEISSDSRECESRFFRSHETSVESEQPGADKPAITEEVVGTGDADGTVPWWESSQALSDSQKTSASPDSGSKKIPLESSKYDSSEPELSLEQDVSDNQGGGHSGVDEIGSAKTYSIEPSPEPDETGKKAPRDIAGKRIPPSPESARKAPAKAHSRALPPELVCRRTPGLQEQWEILLSADEEHGIVKVRQNGEFLSMTDALWSLRSYSVPLQIVSGGGEEREFPVFSGEPLVFRLKKNWTGEGRLVGAITRGYFIVIAPGDRERKGHVPVEAGACSDTDFKAHYFFRDKNESVEETGGFSEHELFSADIFRLEGEQVFDDSEEGDLFVGAVPVLAVSSGIEWARVGEERECGWRGENFRPSGRTLAEVLEGRQGRFFIRVYDSEVKLRDSGEFRYFRGLREILVNGKCYEEHALIAPSREGHSPARVRFVGAGNADISLKLPTGAKHVDARRDELVIAPIADADTVACELESGSEGVDVLLELPRVWWRLERRESDPDRWQDTALLMTREEFRDAARSGAAVRLRLPKRIRSFRVGFGEELEQSYSSRVRKEHGTEILLLDFIDHLQIDRRLSENVSLNARCDGQLVALVRVSADPIPAIVSFVCSTDRISPGGKAMLRWETRNAGAGDVQIAIEPGIGTVDPDGACEIAPCETTVYTLVLKSLGMEEVTESLTVKLVPPPAEKPIVKCKAGWRPGRGFSLGELQTLRLTSFDARRWSIPVDKRRRSVYKENIKTVERLINA